jgi:hypothetical protein
MFAGAAAVEYTERLYAAVEDRERPHPAQNGEGEGVDARHGGIDLTSASFSRADGCASIDWKAVRARYQI